MKANTLLDYDYSCWTFTVYIFSPYHASFFFFFLSQGSQWENSEIPEILQDLEAYSHGPTPLWNAMYDI